MIAIIPARGGSKGLPRKNIKLLNGKPLISYTIEAALKTKYIERVIVSTDSVEIANVAKEYGAEVPFLRPAFLSTDKARSIDVLKYTIAKLEMEMQETINDFVFLQPTSPLRTEVHITEAIDIFKNKNADSVISYCRENHPIFWHKFITDEGKFENVFKDDYLRNRQEIQPTYFPNGAIYIFTKEVLEKDSYYTKNSYAYIMGFKESIDIDTIDDFLYCEWLCKL